MEDREEYKIMPDVVQLVIEELSFEQAYRQLEETVQQLEAGNLPLQEVIALYQRGTALVKYCSLSLDNAELSLKTLTPSGDMVDFEEM
jgi:exodeoxyribonuclease VII small subunit